MELKDIKPIYTNCITVSSVMKVSHLKKILADLPDDMPVVIPNHPDDNYNIVTNCVAVGTAGILSSPYEETKVLCLNVRPNKAGAIGTIADQLNDTIKCEKILF